MAGKFGSPSVVALMDGYDLLVSKLKSLNHKVEQKTEPTIGLGDTSEEHTPVGVGIVDITMAGGFFDSNALAMHEAFATSVPTSPQATVRIFNFGFSGNTIGESMYGLVGGYAFSYDVLAIVGELTKANALIRAAGAVERGLIIQHLTAKTADWNTKTLSTPVDFGAGSSNGAAGYLQCTAGSGFTNFVGKLRDSSDNSTYADLITFVDSVADPYAQRVTAAGTVDRYMSFDGNITGSGTITVLSMLAPL